MSVENKRSRLQHQDVADRLLRPPPLLEGTKQRVGVLEQILGRMGVTELSVLRDHVLPERANEFAPLCVVLGWVGVALVMADCVAAARQPVWHERQFEDGPHSNAHAGSDGSGVRWSEAMVAVRSAQKRREDRRTSTDRLAMNCLLLSLSQKERYKKKQKKQ